MQSCNKYSHLVSSYSCPSALCCSIDFFASRIEESRLSVDICEIPESGTIMLYLHHNYLVIVIRDRLRGSILNNINFLHYCEGSLDLKHLQRLLDHND